MTPCPWCGSKKIRCELVKVNVFRRIATVCQQCNARGPEVDACFGKAAAIKRWNDRAKTI
jgi:Lar family restriction alleviation protein